MKLASHGHFDASYLVLSGGTAEWSPVDLRYRYLYDSAPFLAIDRRRSFRHVVPSFFWQGLDAD